MRPKFTGPWRLQRNAGSGMSLWTRPYEAENGEELVLFGPWVTNELEEEENAA